MGNVRTDISTKAKVTASVGPVFADLGSQPTARCGQAHQVGKSQGAQGAQGPQMAPNHFPASNTWPHQTTPHSEAPCCCSHTCNKNTQSTELWTMCEPIKLALGLLTAGFKLRCNTNYLGGTCSQLAVQKCLGENNPSFLRRLKSPWLHQQQSPLLSATSSQGHPVGFSTFCHYSASSP